MAARMRQLSAGQLVAQDIAVNVCRRALLNATADVVPAHPIHLLQRIAREPIVTGLTAHFHNVLGLTTTHVTAQACQLVRRS